ncbi:C45 family autoproteolytic acyltransferase/hydolase [Cryptosporangium aurantiacum]|uniref:Isopenicillin-N N-acyltransferase like protein n=1 Tax=Cryptosporangium aurantiacum TaxID=134849 RepID=A0A1M7HA73_9ACTN|nr:C45 family peptidase [Cryptosporangium aurantiacum]SHM25384.1 isopenicillin-N N-acyltransferase like protein [Cryptosporangium aurantiacum]
MIVHTWHDDETSPRTRGRRFGTRWADNVAGAWRDYSTLFAARGVADVEGLGIALLDALREWAPYLADELVGIAEGARLPLGRVAALTGRTEILARAGVPATECSTGVYLPPDGGPPHTVQTWDWLTTVANETVVLDIPGPDGRRVRTFTEFGVLGKIGATRGLGVHFNILGHVSDGGAPGVPVHAVARRILDEATGVDDALALARSARVSASSAITVIEPGRAATLEVAPAGVAVVGPGPDGALLHTNDFLDAELAAGNVVEPSSTSSARYRWLATHGDALRLADARERAAAFGVDAATGVRGPVCMAPAAGAPLVDAYETKLTIALDVVTGNLSYVAGSPADVPNRAWVTA